MCFVGEAVAFIVADTRHIAEDALALIDVEYDILEPVVNLRDAISEAAPIAHRGSPDNLVSQLKISYGEIDNEFEKLTVITTG